MTGGVEQVRITHMLAKGDLPVPGVNKADIARTAGVAGRRGDFVCHWLCQCERRTHRYKSPGTYTASITIGSSTLTRDLLIAPGRLQTPDISAINTSPDFEIASLPAFVFSEDDFWNAPSFTGFRSGMADSE